jgi:hypothetical protein
MKKLARLVASCADPVVDDSGLGKLKDRIARAEKAIYDVGILTRA